MPQSKTRVRKHTGPTQTNKYAPTAWGQSGQAYTFDLEVPSGQLCKVKRVTIEGLMKAGILQNLDSLSAIVDEKFISGGKRKSRQADLIDAQKLLADSEALTSVLTTVDKVVCHVVLQPPVMPVPQNPEEPREAGVIYVDTVDIEDKMFIFQYVLGGTSDLEQFRHESAQLVGGVEAVASLPGEAAE